MHWPPMPPWPGFHVLVVHFPIALLLVAPLLMVLAMIAPRKWSGMAFAAWLILLLGTASTWLAVSTGNAARDDAGGLTEQASDVLDQHGKMGETVRNVFTGIWAAYSLVLLAPVVLKKLKLGAIRALGTLIILAVYVWAAGYLANTAHLGGRLVHEFGLHAAVAGSAETPQTAPAAAQPASQPAP